MTEEKKLHVCVVVSDSYLQIYEKIFNRTLPNEFGSVDILHVRDHNSQPGYVGEYNFKRINYKKLEFVAKQMMAHEGDNLLVLDADIVCFENFKNEINNLLKENDMIFQNNPHYKKMPYCIGVWGLQCSKKNIMFFGKEVMPRAEVLLYTEKELNDMYYNKTPVPSCWQHTLNGEPEHYAGDQCVINAALLEGKTGKEIKVSILPDTYTQDASGGKDPKNCVLYHATGVEQGIVNKATHLVNAHERIMKLK
jgi:hypothetical protein